MFRQIEEGRQASDQQTKLTTQSFRPGGPLLEQHDLSAEKPNQDHARCPGGQDPHAAAGEECGSQEQRTAANAKRQHERRNGVIAKRRVVEPRQGNWTRLPASFGALQMVLFLWAKYVNYTNKATAISRPAYDLASTLQTVVAYLTNTIFSLSALCCWRIGKSLPWNSRRYTSRRGRG